jgi:hypothetical protein
VFGLNYAGSATMSNDQKPIASDYESEKVAGSSPVERAKVGPCGKSK